MKGMNTIRLNLATTREMIQYYFDEVLFMKKVYVSDIVIDSQNKELTAIISVEQEKSANAKDS